MTAGGRGAGKRDEPSRGARTKARQATDRRSAGEDAGRPASRRPEPPPREDDAETQVLDSMDDLVFAIEGGKELEHRQDKTLTQDLDDLVAPSEAVEKACLIVMRGTQVGRLYELSGGEAILGRSEDVTVPIADKAVSRRHASIHSSPLGFVIADLDSTNGLFVNGKRTERHVLRDGDRIQFGTSTVLKFSYQDELEENLQKSLYESATRDALLGVHNKQYFLDNLKAAFANATRKEHSLSLLMLDLDHFKKVNDEFGHLAGDHVLKEVAGILQASIRTEDVLARFGGEEFVLLLSDSTRETSLLVAERIRKSIGASAFEYEGQQIRLTISVGVGTYAQRSFPTPESLIAGADAALYEAKRSGRDRVAWRGAPVAPAS